MKKFLLAAVLLTAGACANGYFASSAKASTVIPYPDAGTINPASYTFTATSTGDVTGYFYGFSAADIDEIAMSVNGGPIGTFGLVNQTSLVGQGFNLGPVTAGNTLTFVLFDETTSTTFSSNPSSNGDHDQHVYSTSYSSSGPYAAGGIPDGIFVAFEDLLASQNSDFDYNDDQFVLTNVSTFSCGPQGADCAPGLAPTPLPAALPLFATGLGIVGLLTKKRRKRKNANV